MAAKGLRKLIDIAITSTLLHATLERFLDQHQIAFRKQFHDCEGFVRYYVFIRDLQAAQAVLPALQQIAAGAEEWEAA